MAETTINHAEIVNVDGDGNQQVIYPKTTGDDVSISPIDGNSASTALGSETKSLNNLVNKLGSDAFSNDGVINVYTHNYTYNDDTATGTHTLVGSGQNGKFRAVMTCYIDSVIIGTDIFTVKNNTGESALIMENIYYMIFVDYDNLIIYISVTAGINTYSHSVNDTVHYLTGVGLDGKFTATESAILTSFIVNGEEYSVSGLSRYISSGELYTFSLNTTAKNVVIDCRSVKCGYAIQKGVSGNKFFTITIVNPPTLSNRVSFHISGANNGEIIHSVVNVNGYGTTSIVNSGIEATVSYNSTTGVVTITAPSVSFYDTIWIISNSIIY